MNKESIIYKSVRSCYYGIKNAPQNFQRYLDTRSIKKYHNKHLGQTCFIVGNGPSMTFEDLNKIHELDVPSFACNKIFLAFDNTKWRPTYYFVSDTKILADVDMNKIGIPLNNMFFPRRFIKDINNRKCNYYETLDHTLPDRSSRSGYDRGPRRRSDQGRQQFPRWIGRRQCPQQRRHPSFLFDVCSLFPEQKRPPVRQYQGTRLREPQFPIP